MAWGPFLWSLKVGIVAAAAAAAAAATAVATMPTMTTRGGTVTREKDNMFYHSLFQDLEGYGSYADRGWLVECILN